MKRRTFLIGLGSCPVVLFGCDTSARTDAMSTDKRVTELQDNWRKLYAGDARTASSLEPVRKTAAEWKKQLSDPAFSVLREEGTERPLSSPLNEEKRAGIYSCAGCALPLFTSDMKFESGTGWPSFSPASRIISLQRPTTSWYCHAPNITVCAAAVIRDISSTMARLPRASAGATTAWR